MILDAYALQVATVLCDHRACLRRQTFTGPSMRAIYQQARRAGWRFWREQEERRHWCPEHEEAHRGCGPWVDAPEGPAVYPVGQNPATLARKKAKQDKKRGQKKKSDAPRPLKKRR